MRKHRLLYIMLVGMLAVASQSQGQSTFVNNDPDDRFKQAKEYYAKEQFSLAWPLFKTISTAESNYPITITSEAKYYSIVCGLKMNDATVTTAAREYVDLEHNTARVQMMAFQLGEYYFRNTNYTEALSYYELADAANLTNRELGQMKFHQGYAYFSSQQFAKAKPLFDAIRQIPEDASYIDANYYYGFISFYEKNYKQALTSFKVVENEPAYTRVVPYYIAQIYYFTGEKQKAIEYGEDILKRGGQHYELQLKQLIGHTWFEQKNYEKALPYLEQYVMASDKVRREDLYELSYCYYQTKQYPKAITGFKELGGKEDSLAQNSMYLLADSYLKTNQKANARNAFLFCALNSSNAVQKEISQFHYGKLSYELGFNDVALSELQAFIVAYPKSTYIPEAKDLLVQVMATGSNFKDALALFRTLGSRSDNVKKLFPQVLFGRAVELINDQQLNAAEGLLNEVYGASYNQSVLPYTNFWKGEIAYRTNRYDSAVAYMESYLKSGAVNGEVNPKNARYTLGYALLRKEMYPQAYTNFSTVATTANTTSTAVEQDAFLRSGDALFMQRGYVRASQVYDHVINNNLAGADYALYQKGIIAGASNKTTEKIQLLQSLPKRYPSSSLIPDAQLEIAHTFMANENYRDAITALEAVIKDPKSAQLKTDAYLNLGLAHFNLNNNDEALKAFTTLIRNYPNAEESEAAIEYVRSIYIEQQRPAEFVNFMKQNNRTISYSEQDSLTFVAANLRYDAGDTESALRGFELYLNDFAQGKYAIEANYKAGLIHSRRKEYEDAAKYFASVASKAPNAYAEDAVLQVARIYYFELSDFAKAEQYFIQLKAIATQPQNRLEAMRGLLRAQYKLQKFAEAVTNAGELLNEKGIATDDKMMANLVLAKSYQANSQLAEANSYYRSVINLGRSEFSAEARYRLAEIQVLQTNLTEAEKLAFEAVNKSGSYDYWVTKSYILLGDIYFRQKDYFNAEATLRSVVENAAITELRTEASKKLEEVITEKNKNSKVEQ